MCNVQCAMFNVRCSMFNALQWSLGARSSTRSSPRTVTLGRIEFSSEQMRSVFSEMLFVKSRNTGSAVQCDIKCTKLSVHDVYNVHTVPVLDVWCTSVPVCTVYNVHTTVPVVFMWCEMCRMCGALLCQCVQCALLCQCVQCGVKCVQCAHCASGGNPI